MFKYDDDKFVEDIQLQERVFGQCIEIIIQHISGILWSSKILLGFSDNYYEVKKDFNLNSENFRTTYSILSAIYRYSHNRYPLFEDDTKKIEDKWKNWITKEIDNWFYLDPVFIKIFLRFLNNKEINFNKFNEMLLEKYSWIPWNDDILDESLDYYDEEDYNDDDLGPYCICFKKNRPPCNNLPCITMAEETAKDGKFLD